MNEAYEFLNLYKRLEDLLEAKLNVGETRRGSVVVEFMNSAEGEPYREKLNLCREIRHVMTHNADLDGEPVVIPSDAVVDSLREIVSAIESPRPAAEYATPLEHLMTARMEDYVLDLMRRMEERGFSHVPVLRRGRREGARAPSVRAVPLCRCGRVAVRGLPRVRDEGQGAQKARGRGVPHRRRRAGRSALRDAHALGSDRRTLFRAPETSGRTAEHEKERNI